MSASSINPRPAVWLTACSHGDEVSGIVVIQENLKAFAGGLLAIVFRLFSNESTGI
jgi:predicted deacylase